jgi:hypothetical protein
MVHLNKDSNQSERDNHSPPTRPSPKRNEASILPPELPPFESQTIGILWSKNGFLKDVALGPRYADVLQHSIFNSFWNSPSTLKEAYLATSAAYVQTQHDWHYHDNLEFQCSTVALKRLRQLNEINPNQLEAVSALGVCLVLFHIMTMTSSLHTILTFTLSLLAPWYPTLVDDPIINSHTHHLLFIHTIECLVRREIPLLKCQTTEEPFVDNALGLCSPLLCLFYEVCELSHLLKHNVASGKAEQKQSWSDILARLQRWDPTFPPGFHQEYCSVEAISMMTQARVQQLAALILIHRFMHPYGEEDDSAISKSQAIFLFLEQCFEATGTYPLHTFFPFLVASLEVTDVHQQLEIITLLNVRQKPFSRLFSQRLVGFLQSEWRNRYTVHKPYWLDRIDTLQNMVFLP